jgi:hypothetical protein
MMNVIMLSVIILSVAVLAIKVAYFALVSDKTKSNNSDSGSIWYKIDIPLTLSCTKNNPHMIRQYCLTLTKGWVVIK